jgi:phosphoserine phosphatase
MSDSSTGWVAVLDIDGTVTHKETGALWNVVDRAALHPDGSQELAKLRERFRPAAIAGTLTVTEELFWLRETFRIYVDYGLTRSGWEAAVDTVEIREGILEAFAWFVRHGIPVAAVSYGCADFIERLAARHGIAFDAIYAGRLRHDGDLVVGADVPTFVVPAFKGERSRHFALVHGVDNDRILAVGDTGGDRKLGHLKRNRFFLAKHDEEAEMLRNLGAAHEVQVTRSFEPALDFLKKRTGLP